MMARAEAAEAVDANGLTEKQIDQMLLELAEDRFKGEHAHNMKIGEALRALVPAPFDDPIPSYTSKCLTAINTLAQRAETTHGP